MSPSHLSAHSHYSLLNGLPKIDELVSAAAKQNMPALALTDHNNLYGAIDFYKKCERKGIKPIIGVDLDVALVNTRARIILLAKNKSGYDNLIRLVSAAHVENKDDVHATQTHLETYGADMFVLIPESALDAGGNTFASAVRSLFPADMVFGRLEWNHDAETLQKSAVRLKEFALTPIAASDTYYLKTEDRDARDIVRKVADPSAPPDPRDRTFIGSKKFLEAYRTYPEALENVERVVDAIDIPLSLGSWVFPDFPIPEGTTYEGELEKAVEIGFQNRGMEKTEENIKRVAYELSVINDKGFAPYFLAVADLLKFARENNILSTTRGSAAGSLVSYLTGITNVDPMLYKLPFERFLNPERPKAPDIDMDIADVQREEMIAYSKKLYGEDSVAQIGTFGTLMARAAVRDCARALGYPYGVGDRVAKLIPFGSQGFPMTIDTALEMEEDLRKLYQSDEDVETIINTAKRVEGNARHISVHAAGVVIAPGAVTDFVPIQYDPHGNSIITQYDMHAVEEAGLLKFDFLGLKNLSVLGNAVKRVRVRLNEEIDIENIPIDDKKTFDMLARGETEGVFQLSGGGMTRYLKELEPTSIHDINAMVALYRPGPMEMIPQYIARKKNPVLVTYLDPRMETILDRSYGIITYQDDVLLIAIEIAGYSWLEADILRKAMGKKIPAEMEAQKEKFLTGCVEYGKISAEKASAIWKLIEPFAAYGFNKAHAASYGKVAYQTAYMKANYTPDYMAAVMSADAGNVDRIAEHVAECIRLGITVLPPDVNESFYSFTVVHEATEAGQPTIRFGLGSIKNFGEVGARTMIEERKKNGVYKNLGDFASRTPATTVNKRGIEALIKAGALDTFGDRANMISKLEEILSALKREDKNAENQNALFDMSKTTPVISIQKDDTTALGEKLVWEKELLGIYVSGHPTDQYTEVYSKYPDSIRHAINEKRKGYPVVVGGVIEQVKTILTKKGEHMAFITIADNTHTIEGVVFPKVFKDAKDIFKPGTCVLVKAKVSHRNDEPSLLVDKVKKVG